MQPFEIIQDTYNKGGFWAFEDGKNIQPDDLRNLALDDSIVRKALHHRSRAQVTTYAKVCLNEHGRAPEFDGEWGPAMKAILEEDRCPIPDYYPPPGARFAFEDPDLRKVVEQMAKDGPAQARGSGNWFSCWDVGNYHSASVRVNQSGMGSHLRPVFKEVLTKVRQAYRNVGLLFHFIDSETGQDIVTGEAWEGGRFNIEFTFVARSRGWIGLAIVGQNQSCGSNIWCRFLSGYVGRNVVSEWVTLIMHELGHNCGMGHFPGRANVMNPSIIIGLPGAWTLQDSSTPWLKRAFGGVPVPKDPGVPPDPPTQPPRLEKIERQLELHHQLLLDNAIRDAVQQSEIDYLLDKVR